MSLRRSTRVAVSASNVENAAITDPVVISKKRSPGGEMLSNGTAKKAKKSTAKESPKSAPKSKLPAATDETKFKVPAVPTTPVRKRSTKTTKPPPLTPTPSLVAAMRAPYVPPTNGGTPPLDRPVEPHLSNATLVTPGGTQMVVFPNSIPDSSPSKTGLPKPTATTGTLLEKAEAHLISVDPRIKTIVDKHHCEIFSPKGLAEAVDPFRALTSGIIGQQVSGAAANSIKNKFIGLFNEADGANPKFPTPAQVAKTDIDTLRKAGLSQRKAEYIQGLAEKFANGDLNPKMLMEASDDEVMEKLIAVRGLGKWSVEMFACFSLKRMDILSTGDLGVQRGMAAYFGKDVQKLKAKGGGKWKYMSEQDMLDKSAVYAPYRSLFMWLMWRVEDVNISVMSNDD